MDKRNRRRGVYVSFRQKKKLIEYVTKHPELISCKVTQEFNYQDSQRLWQSIASECNALPGARKTWRQWKKTWQDLRSKTKKRQEHSNGALPSSVLMLSPAEQEALGLKNVSSTTAYQDTTEFVPLEQEGTEESNYLLEMESVASLSDPESPPEEKVFTHSEHKTKFKKYNTRNSTKHSDNCAFNCDMLAAQEKKKIQIKEDYLNFKKDYLRQKLKIMKEQTEALKTIAKELCDK